MNLDQFKSNPSVLEHFGHVAPALDDFLTAKLIATCSDHKGGPTAEAESGAAKMLANLIQTLRGVADPAAPVERKPMKKLHRFESGQPGATTKP